MYFCKTVEFSTNWIQDWIQNIGTFENSRDRFLLEIGSLNSYFKAIWPISNHLWKLLALSKFMKIKLLLWGLLVRLIVKVSSNLPFALVPFFVFLALLLLPISFRQRLASSLILLLLMTLGLPKESRFEKSLYICFLWANTCVQHPQKDTRANSVDVLLVSLNKYLPIGRPITWFKNVYT